MQNEYKITVYRELLKKYKLKNTVGREKVFRILLEAGQPLLPSIICSRIHKIDISTVYRTLKTLVGIGIIRNVARGFKTLYEPGEMFIDHHHHAICEKCGKVELIENNELEQLINRITKAADMIPTFHHIELFGNCKKCIKK